MNLFTIVPLKFMIDSIKQTLCLYIQTMWTFIIWWLITSGLLCSPILIRRPLIFYVEHWSVNTLLVRWPLHSFTKWYDNIVIATLRNKHNDDDERRRRPMQTWSRVPTLTIWSDLFRSNMATDFVSLLKQPLNQSWFYWNGRWRMREWMVSSSSSFF